jgi:hypothetical protein
MAGGYVGQHFLDDPGRDVTLSLQIEPDLLISIRFAENKVAGICSEIALSENMAACQAATPPNCGGQCFLIEGVS